MYKTLLSVFIIFMLQQVKAQRHELGVFLGGANLIGDVGPSSYLDFFPKNVESKIYVPLTVGAIYRFNLNPYMGLRVNLDYALTGDSDLRSKENYKIERNKSYKNNILESSVVFEYNFFDINESKRNQHSPFIFAGVGLARSKYKELEYSDENLPENPKTSDYIVENYKRRNDIVFPIGVGYKYRFNYSWILGLEFGVRYSGSDHFDYNDFKIGKELNNKLLDDNDGTLQKEVDNKRFGNLSNNDWYIFSGLSLTYSFGRPACYCN